MRKVSGAVFASALLLAACSDQQLAKVDAGIKVACLQDGKIVPLAQVIVAAATPVVGAANAGAGAAVGVALTVDEQLVHPLVVDACARINAKPIAVSAGTTTTPAN